jgi:hypothetical protein
LTAEATVKLGLADFIVPIADLSQKTQHNHELER